MISINSPVMTACLVLLKVMVSLSIISPEQGITFVKEFSINNTCHMII